MSNIKKISDINLSQLDFVLARNQGKRKSIPVESELEGYNPDIDPTVFFPENPPPKQQKSKKTRRIRIDDSLNTYAESSAVDHEKELPIKGKDADTLENLENAIYSEYGVVYGPPPTGEDLETSVKTIFNKKWLGKDPEQLERVRQQRKTLGRGGKKHKTHRKKGNKKSKKNRKSVKK